MNCPACSSKRITFFGQAYRCKKCDAIFSETIYLGDSYSLVKPWFAKDPVDPKKLRYFDFTCLGSEGITRRHGWFDPETRLVHQVG